MAAILCAAAMVGLSVVDAGWQIIGLLGQLLILWGFKFVAGLALSGAGYSPASVTPVVGGHSVVP